MSNSMEPEITSLTDKITHIELHDRERLARMMGRPQEYYESLDFFGKVFTFEEMIETCLEGDFDYLTMVEGYNFPSHVLEAFKDSLFDPLSKEEQFLLDLFPTDDQYIIATLGLRDESLKHEIAHGLFATVPEYQQEVLEVLDQLTEIQVTGINAYLSEMTGRGYHSSVHTDETHAYILSDPDMISLAEHPNSKNPFLFKPVIDLMDVIELKKQLELIFDRHYEAHKIES